MMEAGFYGAMLYRDGAAMANYAQLQVMPRAAELPSLSTPTEHMTPHSTFQHVVAPRYTLSTLFEPRVTQ